MKFESFLKIDFKNWPTVEEVKNLFLLSMLFVSGLNIFFFLGITRDRGHKNGVNKKKEYFTG